MEEADWWGRGSWRDVEADIVVGGQGFIDGRGLGGGFRRRGDREVSR